VQNYKLPAICYHKQKLIIDPIVREKIMKLPTTTYGVIERFVPPTVDGHTTPLVEPPTGHGGAAPVPEKRAISIITIRHKKMKKHQLRKLRKRMRFLRRKLEAVKLKKKEKLMVEYERKMSKWATDFNADQSLEEHLTRARRAGWGIDVLSERRAAKIKSIDTEK